MGGQRNVENYSFSFLVTYLIACIFFSESARRNFNLKSAYDSMIPEYVTNAARKPIRISRPIGKHMVKKTEKGMSGRISIVRGSIYGMIEGVPL